MITRRQGVSSVLSTAIAAAALVVLPSAAHAATTCQSDCISWSGALSSPEALRFAFTTTGLTHAQVIVSDLNTANAVAYTQQDGYQWATDYDIVIPRPAQGTTYAYSITATDISGNTWRKSGTAATKTRTAVVKFTTLAMKDDSDRFSAGDIEGGARCAPLSASTAWQPLSPLHLLDPATGTVILTEIDSGTTKALNKTLTCPGAALSVPVQTSVDDDDNNGIPYNVEWLPASTGNPSADSGSNCCHDWASTFENVDDPIPAFGSGTTLPIGFTSYSPALDMDGDNASLQYAVSGTVTFSDLGPLLFPATTSGPVTLGVYVNADNESLGVSWNAGTLPELGSTGFRVSYRKSGDAAWTSTLVGNVSYHAITNLTDGTTYQIQVAKLDSQGLSYAVTSATGTPIAQAPSTLTGWSTAPATLPYQSTVSTPISVTAAGQPRGIFVQYRKAGAIDWTVYSFLLSDANGKATITYPVFAGAVQWRVGAPATVSLGLAVSGARTITSATSIAGFTTTSASAKSGTTLNNTITVTPGAGRTVLLQYKSSGAATWSTFKTYQASSLGSVTVQLVAKPGSYAWRVSVPASTTQGAAATSATRWVTGT